MKVSFLTSNNNNSNNGVTKQYVDDQDALRVAKTGDIMTGPLTLSGDAVNPLHAVSLQQLNEAVNNIDSSDNEFIASGNIPSAGLAVGINNDGTVSVIFGSGEPESLGDLVVFNNDGTYDISAVYDPVNQKVVIVYSDYYGLGYSMAIVGTVSGDSISFGAPVVFSSGSASGMFAIYDPTNNKIIIAYRDDENSGYGTAIVGTVSGDTISFGSPVVFNSGSAYGMSAVYDFVSQKVVIVYRDASNLFRGTAVVGTVSGNSISFGSPVVFTSSEIGWVSAVYDSTNNKVVIAYNGVGNPYYGIAIVGTVSGTSISFGSPVVFNSSYTGYISAVYDPINNKVVIAYQDGGNSHYGTAIVGTVSGNSISFGSPVVFNNAHTSWIFNVYDPANGKVVIFYNDDGNSDYGTTITGTVSENSISFGAPVVFNSATTWFISAVYDPINGRIVIAYNDYGTSYYGVAKTYLPSTLTTNKDTFIGISQQSANNGDTVRVKVFGQVDSNQSGLAPGQIYYLSNYGELTTDGMNNVLVGRALSATKLLITN